MRRRLGAVFQDVAPIVWVQIFLLAMAFNFVVHEVIVIAGWHETWPMQFVKWGIMLVLGYDIGSWLARRHRGC